MEGTEGIIVEDVLHKVAKENNIKNYELTMKPMSSGGANYMSHLYVATYTKKETVEDVNIFAKIAAVGPQLREKRGVNLYLTEIYFYTSIMRKYRGLEEVYGLRNEEKLKLAKFYGVHGDMYQETIVLENLISSGYGMCDRMQSIDWEYAAAAMRELAKFHALSMAYQRTDPEAFEKDASDIKTHFPEGDDLRLMWNVCIKNGMEKLLPQNKASVQRLLDDGVLNESALTKLFAASKQKFLIHGDYRPSNMMHRTLENGEKELIPVDFQTVQAGSPVMDFLYFMVCSTGEAFRTRHYDQMVHYYADHLQEALARLKVDPTQYTKQDFLDELKEKLPLGLGLAFFILPIVTVEENKAPEVNKDMALEDMLEIQTSSQFEVRLNGMVNSYRAWGVIS